MNFAECFHCGTRKDGVSPELAHQVEVVGYLRTLQHLVPLTNKVRTTSTTQRDVTWDCVLAGDPSSSGIGHGADPVMQT